MSLVSYVYHDGRFTHWSQLYAHYKQNVCALLTLQRLLQHVWIRSSTSADYDCMPSLDVNDLSVPAAIEKA
jgi:hypothetical protein